MAQEDYVKNVKDNDTCKLYLFSNLKLRDELKAEDQQ